MFHYTIAINWQSEITGEILSCPENICMVSEFHLRNSFMLPAVCAVGCDSLAAVFHSKLVTTQHRRTTAAKLSWITSILNFNWPG